MTKILIVDDVELNVELLVQLLEGEYELVVAADGEQGVAAAIKERPDLILMDMSLPNMNGWEATRQIKANATLRDVPVIGVSAHAMSGDRAKAIEAGCDDYLTKPIDDELLFAALERWLPNGA